MDAEAAKQKLKAIIDLARQRREARQEFEQRQNQYSTPPSLAAPDAPAPVLVVEEGKLLSPSVEPQSVVEPEPTPETHPHLFIEVHTAELVEYVESRGTDFEKRWEVLSGRILISQRRRRPEDSDAMVVVEEPKSRQKPTEEKLDFGTYKDWRQSVIDHASGNEGKVDPRIVRPQDAPAYHPAEALGFGALSWQGRNNANVK